MEKVLVVETTTTTTTSSEVHSTQQQQQPHNTHGVRGSKVYAFGVCPLALIT
jgi:hypothetical protein